MNSVPYPDTEVERQACLDRLGLNEGERDDVLNEIVILVAKHFHAPVALVSILDRQRQWFKAQVGTEVRGSARSDSFCAYAVAHAEVFEVADSNADARFKDSASVTGPLKVRYYAGAPLLTKEGYALGSLCIIDHVPRPPMSSEDREMLVHFSRVTMSRLTSMRHASYIDEPTGLFNRFRLEEDVSILHDKGEEIDVVTADLLPLDLANAMIRTLGYPYFNRLMAAIRDRMLSALPTHFSLYKISPTRFSFVVPGSTGADVTGIANNILKAFDVPVESDAIPVLATLGIGILRLPADHDFGRDWLRLAVSAADDARSRRIGLAFFRPEIDQAQQRASHILSALAAESPSFPNFYLEFQPKVELHTGQCSSVEALLRWRHPAFGNIGPAEFLPLAAKTALMGVIARWALRSAIEQIAAWQARGMELQVAVNVTAQDLEDPLLITHIQALLAEHGVAAQLLELELTETAWVREASVALDNLREAQRWGVSLAIDDFGTGYSNWTYLLSLPATTVKIDQSLIRGISTSDKSRAVVKTIIQLAASIGYRVVAEGVEKFAELELLRAWGCDDVQGYFFARPMSAANLEDWLPHRPAC